MISIIPDICREYGDYNNGETLIFNVTSVRPKKSAQPNFWTLGLEPPLICEYLEENKI